MAEGIACLKEGRPLQVAEGVWVLQTAFSMFGVLPIKNNALLVRQEGGAGGEAIMVAINLPELSPSEFAEIERLCAFEKAPLKVLFSPGDWHHLHIPAWQARFPEAQTFIVSKRVLAVNKTVRKSNPVLLDRANPSIPLLNPDVFELLPILGCKYSASLCSRETKTRTEVLVFHRPTGTLFITDHLLASNLTHFLGGFKHAFQPNTLGFQIGDRAAARDSVARVLALPGLRRVVFSHLDASVGAVYEKDDLLEKLAAAYQQHFM